MYNVVFISPSLSVFSDLLKNIGIHHQTYFFHSLNEFIESIGLHYKTDVVLLYSDNTSDSILESHYQIKLVTNSPIFIFSQNLQLLDGYELMKTGVDQFVSVPFDSHEIMIRILSFLRTLKTYFHPISQKHFDSIIYFEASNYQIRFNNNLLTLTRPEQSVLITLYNHINQVVSKDEIIDETWDMDSSATNNALTILITRLRKKLHKIGHESIIETIWGVGYRLNYPEDKFILVDSRGE